MLSRPPIQAGLREVVHVSSEMAGLPSHWPWKRLDTVCEGIFDCPHSTPALRDSGPYLARSQDIRSGVFRTEQAAHVAESTYSERIARAEPRDSDLLYSREGTYFGIAAEVPPGLRLCLGQRMVLLRPHPSTVVPRFLRYWLNSPTMALHTRGYRDGSVAERLNLTTIRALPVAVPPLPEQRAIAHILGTLDDKIELNRRMSETLEAMARALFKSWFVDFDPVRAKAEGLDPGLPQPLADLFPARLVDSELGEIPGGWDVGSFGDVVEQVREQENPLVSPHLLFSHYSIPAFDGGQWPTTELGEGIKSQKSRVPPGVILLSKLNPEIERVWLVDIHPGDRAVCSTEFLVLRSRAPSTRSYAYCLARSPLFRQQIEALVTGTSKSHQRAHADTVLGLSAIRAPGPIIKVFDKCASSLLQRTLACRRENRTLAALRDTLLPKLISGELKIESRLIARLERGSLEGLCE
jgi:type I restriction enzyme, S subunit